MNGKLYGVGVGPGDPELLTLKAVRIIREADVIAVPGQKREEAAAYQIASRAVPEISQKPCLPLRMPMTKDAAVLKESHDLAAEQTASVLREGKNVAFLTLGDPAIYATYLYVHRRIREAGFETEMVSGVPSFCAAAARLNIGLAEQADQLHVIPASYQIGEALQLGGTKVLMKAGRHMGEVKRRLLQTDACVWMAENCGMPQEACYYGAEELPEEAGYYSLLIVKERT